MQFLFKHSGAEQSSGQEDSLQGVEFLKIEGMRPRSRKHHLVPTDMRSEWQVEPHEISRNLTLKFQRLGSQCYLSGKHYLPTSLSAALEIFVLLVEKGRVKAEWRSVWRDCV